MIPGVFLLLGMVSKKGLEYFLRFFLGIRSQRIEVRKAKAQHWGKGRKEKMRDGLFKLALVRGQIGIKGNVYL